jgi:hypothetical protein
MLNRPGDAAALASSHHLMRFSARLFFLNPAHRLRREAMASVAKQLTLTTLPDPPIAPDSVSVPWSVIGAAPVIGSRAFMLLYPLCLENPVSAEHRCSLS